jgi:hypothetical protein
MFGRSVLMATTLIGLAPALGNCGVDRHHIPPTPPNDQPKHAP